MRLVWIKEETMRHVKPQPIRNKIDLADPNQIRILRRRLGISADDLQRVVAKVGNSIAAVCKEIEPQKPVPAIEPMPVQIEAPSALEVGVATSAA
jgi:translation elongation factor EF-4